MQFESKVPFSEFIKFKKNKDPSLVRWNEEKIIHPKIFIKYPTFLPKYLRNVSQNAMTLFLHLGNLTALSIANGYHFAFPDYKSIKDSLDIQNRVLHEKIYELECKKKVMIFKMDQENRFYTKTVFIVPVFFDPTSFNDLSNYIANSLGGSSTQYFNELHECYKSD